MRVCVTILICTVTSTSLAGEFNDGAFVCGQGIDNSGKNQCQNGYSCVLLKHICDGVADCLDGSDELFCPHHMEKNSLKLNRSKRQLTCGNDKWQCRDGYCVERSQVCNGVADCYDSSDEAYSICHSTTQPSKPCVLPPYPEHGTYTVRNAPLARPGESYPSFVLEVICQRGYGMTAPFDKDGGTEIVYCINGEWSQNMPKCVRFCQLQPDPSILYTCRSTAGVGLCKKYVPPGTTVEPVCNAPNYYSSENFSRMRCVSGFWDYVALCKAECGRITPVGTQLVVGGTAAMRGELPWHAGVYRKTTDPYTQLCGASLISNNVVISAAHCFWTDRQKLLPASDFGVAIGKLHRPWDSEEDDGAQKSDVKKIKVPRLFQGISTNFQEDIAALILSTPFNYTTFIRPVCLDFKNNFERLQLQPGQFGKVAGWGLTAANGVASEALKVIDMPYVNEETCIKNLPLSFIEYFSGDKFCAGYTSGGALCRGDSGGGLAFLGRELGTDRYYLRGVVSAAPADNNKLCNDNTYTTFTKITKHQDFIAEALAESTGKTCPMFLFQCDDGSCADPGSECNGRLDCPDGSDESNHYCQVGPQTSYRERQPSIMKVSNQSSQRPIQVQHNQEPQTTPVTRPRVIERTSSSGSSSECGVISANVGTQPHFYNGRSFFKGELPWLVAIFKSNTGSLSYVCGGTLISSRHIISVGHVIFRKSVISIKTIVVKLGASNLNDWSDDVSISRKLISVSLIDTFNPTTLANDICILTLNTKVEFNAYIRPICLWEGDTDLSRIVGINGVFGGWGEVKAENHQLGDPHILIMPIVSTATCRASHQAFSFLTSDKTFCAGYRNGSSPCIGDSGGGVYFHDDGKWRLRGVLSLALAQQSGDDRCSKYEYVVFTDVAKYLPWIKKVIYETIYD